MAEGQAIVVVVNATSKQGTSVVISLLHTQKFVVKAITRNASSDSALSQTCPLLSRCQARDLATCRVAYGCSC